MSREENFEFDMNEAEDIFECAHFDITDELLSRAKIAAYMFGQIIKNSRGDEKPYNEKTFPGKAVDIMIVDGSENVIEIFLDSFEFAWDSKFRYNGKICKLSPNQMGQFFKSEFYRRMMNAVSTKWPISDPTFKKYYEACVQKKMLVGPPSESLNEVDQPGKRKDLANKDVTGDGVRDYSATGRKIQTFGDMGVKGKSGKYYCWPNPKFPFKWSQWKDWSKIKPLCKMSFVHNNRHYMVSLSPYDENFENRGFRGADTDWEPPLAWLTPGECEQVMKLNIVKKFVKKCVKRIMGYIRIPAEEIYQKINNKEKISLEEIRKTQRVLRHVVDASLRSNKADNYCWKD